MKVFLGFLQLCILFNAIRWVHSLEHRRKPVATTPQPDVMTPQPDITTPHPDVTTPQPDMTTLAGVTTSDPVVTTTKTEAATVDTSGTSESKAIPKKTFLEKLNHLVFLVDRGFRSVGSNFKTLYGNFDLIGALAIEKLHSSVRALELLERRRKPVATTPQPEATTTPRFTTQNPVVTTTKTEVCRDRWTKNGASSFSFCTCAQHCSVNDAMKKCREKQAELAKCNSRELENFFALSLNTTTYILLGGNDREEEGTWRWPDRSLLNASYTNWESGQPDGGTSQNCLEWYAPDAKWYDVSCDYRYMAYDAGFVCEKKLL